MPPATVPDAAAPPPAAPDGAGEAGRRLWAAVTGEYDLAEHELALLRQAVSTADLCETLQTVVGEQGPLRDGKAHPALVELRQQRILLARLVVALRVPMGDEDGADAGSANRTQYRGLRGVYSIKGGAA